MNDRLRVLLIDDAPENTDRIRAHLRSQWADVVLHRVDTLQEMRAELETGGWDVIIGHCNTSGCRACKALALRQELGSDIPFIVVSGLVGEETVATMIKAGADDFVMHGNLARLPPAIGRALRETAMRRQTAQAQEALRLSEKRLRAITSAMGEAVFVTDPLGALRWMNPEAERLLGWREEELIGKQIHYIIHRPSLHAPASDVACCGSLLALRDHRIHRVEDDLFLRKDGTPVPVSFVATPLFEDGEIVGAVTAMQDISARKRAGQELLEARRRSQALSEHLQSVREEERTRIARELHDELGQMLTALKIDTAWLQNRLGSKDKAVQEKIAGMNGLITDTLDWVRHMSSDLRPVMLDDLGLRAAVEWLLEGFSQRYGVVAHLVAAQQEPQFDQESSTAAFRIVQECLTNVARHARAREVTVTLAWNAAAIDIVVSDDGTGFDPQKQCLRKTYGLLGIRERAETRGGTFRLESRPGHGTTVTIRLPLAARQETCP